MKRIRKAVIPAAGIGTRLLPATKVIPKEMLPIVDKPIIQYVVEEAVESGFEDIIFVTSKGKNEIEDHFDYDYRLEHSLSQQGKEELRRSVSYLSEMISISSIRQKKPLGLGHAVQVAQPFVANEPFGVFLGDDIIVSDVPGMRQLLQVYETYQASVVAVREVSWEVVSRYGLVVTETLGDEEDGIFKVLDMVEKHRREDAPSNLAIIGRYILTPKIFQALEQTAPGSGGEIQLTDGLRCLLKEEPVYACRVKGSRYDAGNKLGYLIATVELALAREDLGADFRDYLKSLQL